MSSGDRERLLAHLQLAANAALGLLGLPSNAWGDLTLKVEAGKVVLPVEARLTFK